MCICVYTSLHQFEIKWLLLHQGCMVYIPYSTSVENVRLQWFKMNSLKSPIILWHIKKRIDLSKKQIFFFILTPSHSPRILLFVQVLLLLNYSFASIVYWYRSLHIWKFRRRCHMWSLVRTAKTSQLPNLSQISHWFSRWFLVWDEVSP